MADVRDGQVRWLADRLALAIAALTQMEIDSAFVEGENIFSEAKHMVLSDLMSFDKARVECRTSERYTQALDDIRERVRKINHTGERNG